MRNKVVSADQAIAVIRDGDTFCNSGFVGNGTPDALLAALERRFLTTGGPKDLTLIFAAGQGDGKERGLNRVGHAGLLKRVVGGHWGLIPKVARLALDNRIEAYNLPQGIISHLYRDIAAGKPGVISKVGLGTFVDPRLDGGRLNAATTEPVVDLIELAGEEWLFYKAMPINIAFIRGTTADPSGNMSMEREALVLDALAMAQAVRNSGGIVIAQVERLAEQGTLSPRNVIVPGVLVDCVVVAEPEHHMQTYATPYSPAFAHEIKVPLSTLAPMPLDERKIIARRAAMELGLNGVINLGIGMPEGVADVANEENIHTLVTLTAEPGIVGGVPAGGLNFGAAVNTECLVTQNQQFDFYDGGGLDLTCLGMAQADAAGNVNVSRFGSRLAGAGGFINISQNARKVVFVGTFTAQGLGIVAADGHLTLTHEGHSRKFLKRVEHVTFSGTVASESGREVLYVTERCVFRLVSGGLELAEVAPGIDVAKDILAHMAFQPFVRAPKLMDTRIFHDRPMGLRQDLLHLDMGRRLTVDNVGNRLFVNLEGWRLRTPQDLAALHAMLDHAAAPLTCPFSLLLNLDNFSPDEEMSTAWLEALADLQRRAGPPPQRYTSMVFKRLRDRR